MQVPNNIMNHEVYTIIILNSWSQDDTDATERTPKTAESVFKIQERSHTSSFILVSSIQVKAS